MTQLLSLSEESVMQNTMVIGLGFGFGFGCGFGCGFGLKTRCA